MTRELEELKESLRASGQSWPSDLDESVAGLRALVDAVELEVNLGAYMEVPVCIGLAWDPLMPNSICKECAAMEDCKRVFARTLKRRQEAGGDIGDWCRDLGVTPEAVRAVIEAGVPMLGTPKVPPVVAGVAVLVEAEPSPKKAKSKKGKAEKAPRPKKKRVPDRPTMARCAPTAAAPGAARSSRAVAVEALGMPLGPRTRRREGPKRQWPRSTWPARYRRERERSAWIAALRPGMTLERTYRGRDWGVQVLHPRYYLLLNSPPEEFPTLQAVVERIVGYRQPSESQTRSAKRCLCPWSAVRFFSLRTLLGADRRLVR